MSTKEVAQKEPRAPKAWEAWFVIAFMMFAVLCSEVVWGFTPHIPILMANVVIAIVAVRCRFSLAHIVASGVKSVQTVSETIIILICVGMLIASWVYSGTIPTMVYYGLDLIHPAAFLPLGCILTFLVSIATGSSWTSAGTIGVALMGIAIGLDIPPAIAAGMVVSGAYAGDKFSPLSDTTNMAAAMAKTPVYDHVKNMMPTTFISLVITCVIFFFLGLNVTNAVGYDPSQAQAIQSALSDVFYLSPWLLLPIVVVIYGAIKKIPAIPTMILAIAAGMVIAFFAQGTSFSTLFPALQYGASFETVNEYANSLLNRGGFDSMLWTASLIMITLFFGGILEHCGFVEVLLGGFVEKVKSVRSLIIATVLTGILCDFLLAGQMLAIFIPSKLYGEKFKEFGLSKNMLSRSCEDGGTLWSCMVPWAGCGAYMSSTLGVSIFSYAPFALFMFVSPLFAMISASLGFFIQYEEEEGKTRAEIKEIRAKRRAAVKAGAKA